MSTAGYDEPHPCITLSSHNANAQSKQTLALLRTALTSPYPPASAHSPAGKAPLEFEINELENTPPTADQIRILLSYLKLPLSSLVSAHPSTTGRVDSPEALVEAATGNPKVFRYPVVVNWEDGDAALEVGGVKKMLDKLAQRRDGGSSSGESKKGWF